jgi:hypothetical protein
MKHLLLTAALFVFAVLTLAGCKGEPGVDPKASDTTKTGTTPTPGLTLYGRLRQPFTTLFDNSILLTDAKTYSVERYDVKGGLSQTHPLAKITQEQVDWLIAAAGTGSSRQVKRADFSDKSVQIWYAYSEKYSAWAVIAASSSVGCLVDWVGKDDVEFKYSSGLSFPNPDAVGQGVVTNLGSAPGKEPLARINITKP